MAQRAWFALAALLCVGSADAQTTSPPELALRVINDPTTTAARLAVMRGTTELGSIALAPGSAPAAIDAGVKGALWHPNGRDVALGINGPRASFVVVFLQQAGGTYLAVDVSNVERANIGFIGPFRTYSDRHTEPVQWLNLSRIEALGSRYDGAAAVQIRLRTRAWDARGQRYTGAQALTITRDGTLLWR